MATISSSQTHESSDSGRPISPSPTSPPYHLTEADYTGETVDGGTFRLDCIFKITIVVGETQVALLRGSGLGELKACQIWSVLSTSTDQEPESPSPTQTSSVGTKARARSTTSAASVKPVIGIVRGPSRLQRPSPSVSSFRPLQVTSPTLRKATPSIFETIAPQSVYQCDQPAPKERGITPAPATPSSTTGAKRAPQTPGTARKGTATPSTTLYKRSCQCWEQKRRRPIPDAFLSSRTSANPSKCTQPGCGGEMILERDLASPLSEGAGDQPHFSLAAESPPHDSGPVSEKTAYFTMDDTNDMLCFYGVQPGKYRLRVQAVLRSVRLDCLPSETGGAAPAGPVEGIMMPFIPRSQKNNLTVHLRHLQHTTTGELEPWITKEYLSKSVSTSGPSQSSWDAYAATTTVRFTFATTHELGIGWGPANIPAEQMTWYKQHLPTAVENSLASLMDTPENRDPPQMSTWTDPGIRHRSVYSSDPEALANLLREKIVITPERWEYRVEQSALFTLDPHRWQCTTTLTLSVEPANVNTNVDPWRGGQFAEFTFTLLTDAPQTVQLTQAEYEHDIVHWQVIYPDEPDLAASYPSTP
ncbi:hypothetical protein IWQ62_005728, partial [Dispira parvispora]